MVYTVKYNQSSVPQVGDTLLVDTVDSDNEKGEMSWSRLAQEFSIADDQGDSDVVNLPETLTFLGGDGLSTVIGDNTVTYSIDSSGVVSGTYGNDSSVPVLTINNRGQVTSVSTQSIPQPTPYVSIPFSGGASGASVTFTPPEGTYLSSTAGTFSGGGFGPNTFVEGEVYGPTDGTEVGMTLPADSLAIVSQPAS